MKKKPTESKANPFDRTVTKAKFDVIGRKIKGAIGKPGISRQKALDTRKDTLLKEYQQRKVSGKFLDKRIGEKDFSLSLEDKMAQRYAREKQKQLGKTKKKNIFNLEEASLTHHGRHLDNIGSEDDDFAAEGISDSEDDAGQVDRETVGLYHFGGFGESDEAGQQQKKKTKSEIMKEVMAKSKFFKFQKQQILEENADLVQSLDDDFDQVRQFLDFSSKKKEAGKNKEDDTLDYDKAVKELIYERKATPSDRIRSKEEIEEMKKEKAEKEEEKRMKRMRGESDEEEDDAEDDDDEDDGSDDDDDASDEDDDDEDDKSEEDDENDDDDYENDDNDDNDDQDAVDRQHLDSIPFSPENIQEIVNPSIPDSKPDTLTTSNSIYELIAKIIQSSELSILNSLVTKLQEIGVKDQMKLGEAFQKILKNMENGSNSQFILVIFLVNHFFSTSDMKHRIVTPSLLMVAQKLEFNMLESRKEIAEGLVLSDLYLAMQKDSKRYSPEIINFLFSVFDKFEFFDFKEKFNEAHPAKTSNLLLRPFKSKKIISIERILFDPAELDEAFDESILLVAIDLMQNAILLYSASSSFSPIFSVFYKKLEVANDHRLEELKLKLGKALEECESSRKKLKWQSHKPVPLVSLEPDYEVGYNLDRAHDDGSEVKKLRTMYKKEKKGALRELRRDAKFLAEQKKQERERKDKEYKTKIASIYNVLQSEQAESKKRGSKRR